MAAEIDFAYRSEPSETEAIPVPDEERGFGKVVLDRDRLHYGVGKLLFKRTDRRRIAREYIPRERVYLIDGKVHWIFLKRMELCGAT